MKTQEQKNWEKVHPKGKAPLSWDLTDYKVWKEEAPESLMSTGETEGEAMEEEDVADWVTEEVQTIRIIKEEFPGKSPDLERDFWLDLEYLKSLGKITEEEYEKLKDEDLFSFGK
jgi:hypothetical protein